MQVRVGTEGDGHGVRPPMDIAGKLGPVEGSPVDADAEDDPFCSRDRAPC